jgi:hypothetical protein
MSNRYSLKQFNTDMQQLGGMIETFYSHQGGAQKGGKCRKNSKRKAMKGNKGNKGKKQKGGAPARYYKVLIVNGRPYPFYRRYKGAEPKDAAKKAGKFICKMLKLGKKDCKLTFQLKETTRGSDKRVYGPYKGHYEKLAKPRTLKFPGKNSFQVTHKFIVKLAKKVNN